MKNVENNILSSINSLKDEILNLTKIVIKNLQKENEKLQQKYEQLERCHAKYESNYNVLAQYGRWSNVVQSGITEQGLF